MPQSLAQRCQWAFTNRSWSAGANYFRQGRVDIDGVTEAGELSAFVSGNQDDYFVTLDWSAARADRMLQVGCSCPHYADGHLCKHLAATILQADAEQFSQRIPGEGRLELIDGFLYSADDGEDDEFEFVGPENLSRVRLSSSSPASRRAAAPRRQQKKAPDWADHIHSLARHLQRTQPTSPALDAAPKRRLISYRLNRRELTEHGRFRVAFYQREVKRNGELGKAKPFSINARHVASLPDAIDRELFSLLLGAQANNERYAYYGDSMLFPDADHCLVAPLSYARIVPLLCASGRFGWLTKDIYRYAYDEPNDVEPIAWDEGPPWQYRLQLVRGLQGRGWRLQAALWRPGESIPASSVQFAGDGIALFERSAALFEGAGGDWLTAPAVREGIDIPEKQLNEFIVSLAKLPGLPPLELPDEAGWREAQGAPSPKAVIRSPKYGGANSPLIGNLSFDYGGGQEVAWRDPRQSLAAADRKELIRRDATKEQQAWQSLLERRAKPADANRYYPPEHDFEVSRRDLPDAVAQLTADGWAIEAEGYKLRRPGDFKINVTSGIDWFELDAHADYDGVSASLPDLLKALEQGETFVKLGDGTRGMLPQEWLTRYAPLAQLGKLEDGKLRFANAQALLIDAWLAEQPGVDLDATFKQVRDRLQSFRGIKPAREPKSFRGRLRDYQRVGLGWLNFLDDFGFGGCLADDMGLGKTVQLLALLEARRAAAHGADHASAPSLVVAPRSLVHNWIEEASRFAPALRVLDYTGLGRAQQRQQFTGHHLVVTTYGTLRRDIGHLKDFVFDYCILDEAQAIKNADSQAAKSCRLLSARHRLAMTGTPIENHLGELWSIFEFLNPGLLGRSSLIKQLSSETATPNSPALDALAKGLRPFLLRRTKEQVLKELPEKTEQTLYCELEKKQRKQYDELLRHYRDSLGKRIEAEGLKKSKIQVLEALLRLRQAACHPGLLDAKLRKDPSAKLTTLMEQLEEVLDGGHKALVFSQFTTLLAIVRAELDRQKIAYEYLDGQTRDRKTRVDRFQKDPACPLFLISLKAGGLGLNRTAADYVFILDPWWNPAAEAQAVDRAHRLGQTRRVFAYRLIARNTIEEKILELQADKRRLAEAIVSADNRVLGKLTAEDLQWLLS